MFSKFKAFSLSEVLIVISIIGVLATLVLPSVSNGLEEQQIISKLRKIYPELEVAYNNIVSEHGKPIEWNLANNANVATMTQKMYEYTLEQLPVQKACGTSAGCFPSWTAVDDNNQWYKMVLKDGTFLAVGVENMNQIRSNVAGSSGQDADDIACKGYMGKYFVDVLGKDGDDESGHDIFEFSMCYDNGLVPDGDGPNGPSLSASNGYTAWALKAGNLDYLKCNDLNWETKRTCK